MRKISDAPDYWVPESHVFKTSEECIKAFPKQPAVGLFKREWQIKYDAAVGHLKSTKNRIKNFWKDEYLIKCIDDALKIMGETDD